MRIATVEKLSDKLTSIKNDQLAWVVNNEIWQPAEFSGDNDRYKPAAIRRSNFFPTKTIGI